MTRRPAAQTLANICLADPGTWHLWHCFRSHYTAEKAALRIRDGEAEVWSPAGTFKTHIRTGRDGYSVYVCLPDPAQEIDVSTDRIHDIHRAAADACRTRPGTWHLVRTYRDHRYAGRTAQFILNGTIPYYRPRGHFETLIRTSPEGHPALWARYTPPEETP